MKIAVIGSGIAGLAATWLLSRKYNVTLYEKNDTPGGHSRTVDVQAGGSTIPVDTGFIVFNKRNYPHLTAFFDHLQVEYEQSDMSFAASIDDGWLEYGTQSLPAIFAQKRNLLRPAFWKCLRDVNRFFNEAPKLLEDESANPSLGEYIDSLQVGEWFRRHYILPMGGAIWSCPPQQMLAFPAKSFIHFFRNHGLLATSGQPQWYTVSGGSRRYVEKVIGSMKADIKIATPVIRVNRHEGGAEVTDSSGNTERYDHVIFASHADETLQLLADADEAEQSFLSAFTYQKNTAYLHSDTSLLPKRKACWASWVYLSRGRDDTNPAIAVSYYMNRLQNIDPATPLIVTLNPDIPPATNKTYDTHNFTHPVFTQEAIDAQGRLPAVQGKSNTWFCGAYQSYGFHEDGMRSGVEVARALGVDIPWAEQ